MVGAGGVHKEVGERVGEREGATVVHQVSISQEKLVESAEGGAVGATGGVRETGKEVMVGGEVGRFRGKDGQCVGSGFDGESEGHVRAKLW